ncbi:sensor histidine kinase [Propionispira raffinosivorans]|uniref:sensor histidine kinase n=1 Tax=Propionispira raffinosivorans TaxID=86959 RepID=UPI00037EC274|nr:sensor histidine kinase [Propionispira raffinosivorans]
MKQHRNLILFALMLLLVPLAGEPKFHPFTGDLASFRVSFGSPLFLLFLLWLRNVPFVVSGFSVGLAVTIFRIFLDLWTTTISFSTSLGLHGPTFFYYLTYAACFHIPKFNAALYNKALQIAGWSILAEIAASIAELTMTSIYASSDFNITLSVLIKISAIAFLRCFFILSFFFLTQIYQAETRANHEHQQKQHMLLLISNLYEEVIQLNKSQKNAEAVTLNCYKIYENLQDQATIIDPTKLASEILSIAGQVHEIKKDNQRIYAGLRQLTNNRELKDYMPTTALVDLIIESNRKYAKALQKEITFTSHVDPQLPALHVYTVLSLVNNLVANAVEAIEKSGTIELHFTKMADMIKIQISDTGIGISPQKVPLLFKPGYTTKFDSIGNPSTGVGLAYVKHLTEELHGNIIVTVEDKTSFLLSIPLLNLKG